MLRRGQVLMRSIPNPNAELTPFQHAKALPLRMPSIILVATFSDQNLGSVSRIMLNYGLSDLRLVAPECNHLSDDARRLAVNSVDLLENARIFTTLKEAVSDLQVCLATTSRSRNANFKTFSPATAAQAVIKTSNFLSSPSSSASSDPPFSSGIVFGPEKNGLNNADLSLCNGVINIDTFDKYPVLNLAQSVNCVGYELWNRRIALGDRGGTLEPVLGPGDEAAPQRDLDFFFSRLETALSDRGYQAGGRQNNDESAGDGGMTQQRQHFRGLQGVYKRAGVTSNELKMLQGMLSSLLRER